MPRRNRKGRPIPNGDQLAAAVDVQVAIVTVSDGKYPCAGCRKRGHWNGQYCTPCTGRIVISARRAVLGR